MKLCRLHFVLWSFLLFNSCSSSDETPQENIVINVSDVNIQVEENQENGQVLGSINGSTNQGSLTYSLISVSPAGAISINSSNGDISVANSDFFEFDTTQGITAIVEVKNGTEKKEVTITIDLIEIIEPITIQLQDFEVEIAENPEQNQTLGTVELITNASSVLFSLSQLSHENSLIIDSSSGEIKVGDSSVFDYEQNPVITAVVTAEVDGVTDSSDITINLTDVLETSISFTEIDVNGAHFSGRTSMGCVEFQNKLFVIGGWDGVDKTDVWSSDDGVNWQNIGSFGKVTQQGRTSGFNLRLVVFEGKLWIITAGAGAATPSEIWSSSDGISWEETIPDGEYFEGLTANEVLVFNNKLWVIGGQGGHDSGVYSSLDGVTWVHESISGTSFSGLREHRAVSFNNKIYVIGGNRIGAGVTNEIWSSPDGINWTLEETATPKFSARSLHQVEILDGQLWLIAGAGEEYYNDVWVSSNGIDWDEAVIVGEHFSQRAFHATTIFNSQLWVIGGRFEAGPRLNDIWVMD
ncbi:Kelch repeat-containing protein [Flagellimonas sp.]|uniref:Kelch repeat-containing protein n=1 Tax=Flagellimonas sp. TaxID=2058762 RepID=UPI003B51BC7D